MQHLNEILQYCIRIECDGKVGSGTLYVPENYDRAYILTAAHNIPVNEENYDGYAIKIFYETYNQVKEYMPRGTVDEDTNGTYQVGFLKDYVLGEEGGQNDGAVIEIPKEPWMKNSTYQFGRASVQQKMEGVGYPKAGQNKYVEFQCWVLESVAASNAEEPRDLRVRYKFDDYRDSMPTGKDFLDGYSGMGLFLQDTVGSNLQLSAIFSRDAGETAVLYATDIVRIYELIESMMSRCFLAYPKATYVDCKNLSKRDMVRREDCLNTILEAVYHNSRDYFRCLCGYTGVGKTYTVNLVNSYHPQFIFEHSWTKLMACLNGKKLKELKNTIYIMDPMEQLLSRDERRQLSEGRSSDTGIGRLNTDEKLKLFKKIEERSQDLKQYNIHILFIGHNFFWKDVEKRLEDDNKMVLSQKLRNSIIVCHGLEPKEVKEILEEDEIKCPEYFYDIPLIMRPQWLRYVIDNREKLPEKNENQYHYEFRLYDETIEWFEKIGNASGEVESFEISELEELNTRLKDYLIEDIEFRGNIKLKWKNEYIFLLNTYPFEETDKGFQFTDKILYSYFVAKTLYEYSKSGKQRDFLKCFMDVADMARSNQMMRVRIPFFLLLFLDRDKSGDADNNVKRWLRENYEDGYNWLYDNSLLLLRSEGKNSERKYAYNVKNEEFLVSERFKEQAQKFERGEILTEEDRITDEKGYVRIKNIRL